MLAGDVELPVDQLVELRAMVNASEVPAPVARRARIVLWRAEGRQKKEVAVWLGCSGPAVDLRLFRYAQGGVDEVTRARQAYLRMGPEDLPCPGRPPIN
jgi:hypothetical protein